MNVLQNVKVALKGFSRAAEKKAPTLLMAAAVGGVVATAVFSFKAAPKAKDIIEGKRKDLESIPDDDKETKKTVVIETVKELTPVVAPMVISGGMTIACIIFAHSVNYRRQLALTAAYNIADASLKEYQESAKKIVGPKKLQQIKDDVFQKRIEENPPSKNTIVLSGNGDMLCCDSFTGRYFRSNPEAIRKAVNELNMRLMGEYYVSVNDFYDILNVPELKPVKYGDDVGWNIGDGDLVEVVFSSFLTDNEEPCLYLDYMIEPRWDYRILH